MLDIVEKTNCNKGQLLLVSLQLQLKQKNEYIYRTK